MYFKLPMYINIWIKLWF